MLHVGSIAISAFLLFCSVCAPAVGMEEEKEEPIYYQDTAATYGDTVSSGGTEVVTIPYLSRSITKSHSLALQFPYYEYSPAIGACASVAAGNVVGFYDRYDENLIPNHVSGTAIANTFMYSMEDSAVREVIDQLYEYMGSSTVGTTQDAFINGLTNFCKDKGKNITFSSCMKYGSFSYSATQSYMESNQPVILFLSGYNVGTLLESDKKDTMSYYVSEANHIMVGFGYRVYTYTTSSGSVSYSYVSVASGLIDKPKGFYNFNYKTKINDALAVNIY